MPEKQAVITLHPLFLPDILPFRSLTFASDLDTINIGRASTREEKNMAPAHHNAWFESRVMSRDHASLMVSLDKKAVYLRDNKSMHGTWVNDKKVTPNTDIPIRTDDVLTFGAEVTRGAETFPPLRARCECQWFDPVEDKPAPKSPLPQRPNSFCVPDDDDYPEEVVPQTVPTKCAVEDAYPVDDSDIASDAENEAPSEHTPMPSSSSKGGPSVEPDSADHPTSSQDPRHKLDFGPYSSPIGLCGKEPSEISQDDILHIDDGSNDDDDGADSYPGSMYEDEDLGRCSDWDYDNYSNDLDDGSRPELCVSEPKGGASNEVNCTSVAESHNTGYAEPRNDMEDEIFIPWGSNTNSVGAIPKQKEAEGHFASSAADKLESGLDKSAPGPQLQGPEHFETESRRVPPSLAAFAPGPTMNPSGRTYDRGFPHYNHFAPPTSFHAYPPRGSSQYDPCLLSAQGNSRAPYRDGPFMSNQPIAPSGGSSTASNLPEPPYFGNLVDIAKRLDGSYQQREQPCQDISFIIADDKPSGTSDNIKAHPSILETVKPSEDVAKKSLKRKASEIELESPTSDSCVDPSLFEKRPFGDSALRTASTSQESFSQDAQRVPDGEAKCSISQLTDLHPIEKQHTESGPDGQPPRKRVNTGKKSGARSFATHATTAVVGAMLGGLGTIIALASLPPEYFA